MTDRTEEIRNYREKVKRANVEATKREAFKDLLNRLYSHDEETKALIDVITGGAEKRIVNIPRKEKIHRGTADQLYNKIIIEFENDLSRTLTHSGNSLPARHLGRLALEIKGHLTNEFREIDALVEKLIGSAGR